MHVNNLFHNLVHFVTLVTVTEPHAYNFTREMSCGHAVNAGEVTSINIGGGGGGHCPPPPQKSRPNDVTNQPELSLIMTDTKIQSKAA